MRFVSPGGSTSFFRIEGHCLENVVYGRLDGAIASRLQLELDQIEAIHGTFVAFSYWASVTEYDSEFRARWARWLATKPDGALADAHFMTRSWILRLGIAVANVAYPPVRFSVHSHDAPYFAAREQRMQDAPFPTP